MAINLRFARCLDFWMYHNQGEVFLQIFAMTVSEVLSLVTRSTIYSFMKTQDRIEGPPESLIILKLINPCFSTSDIRVQGQRDQKEESDAGGIGGRAESHSSKEEVCKVVEL
ncbi:hypothetical protein E2986_13489 [Frieseomelitta varia]|uniref:Uncharacterized protein n=1 Tax=Frieseomelitta varia TaxID=561572 RepID=A0A833W1J0_9HYME|nr:hypothetical protein E2986_13489 [Frieseomelitta varia]